jgi:hypothetical protein
MKHNIFPDVIYTRNQNFWVCFRLLGLSILWFVKSKIKRSIIYQKYISMWCTFICTTEIQKKIFDNLKKKSGDLERPFRYCTDFTSYARMGLLALRGHLRRKAATHAWTTTIFGRFGSPLFELPMDKWTVPSAFFVLYVHAYIRTFFHRLSHSS